MLVRLRKGAAGGGDNAVTGNYQVSLAGDGGFIKVGRWMSNTEFEMVQCSGRMVEGAGGQTFVTTGGAESFSAALKGSIYAEFEVPSNSLLQGGGPNWYKASGPNAGKAMQSALNKQGGQLLPEIRGLKQITVK